MSASTGDEIVPALVAAIVAGLVMAMAMMAYAMLRGESPWTNPDLIAAMCMRERVANGRLGIPTLTGFATHMMTSALMGIVAVPFIYGLPAWRTMLASLSYALASYPLVFVTVMTWADPVMVRCGERSSCR